MFSKAICKRITPHISNEIAFWQRAFLPDRDRQELIFSLKAAMDDFRHLSTKFCAVFVDFADAFGSIEHDFLFETLREFDIPLIYCCLVEDLYRYSSFSVICGYELSKEFNIIRGTKTGDPLSALLFILVIDRVCKPMVREAVIRQGIEDERRINPLPLQAFEDDVVVVNYDATIINEMFDIGKVAMEMAGLEVKPSKCAVMYARRSGNNWYKGKADKKPTVSIQGNAIEVYPRDKPYKYLGKSLSLSGEDSVQVLEVIESYKDLLEKITICKLPLALKASALNNLALAKILHHFCNTRFTEEQLEFMDKSLVKAARNMYDLYETTTQLIVFLPRKHGGIGVKRVSDVYRSTRVAFLIKMLNHPQLQFKNIARQSLNLDMEKRNVAATDDDMNFLGFEISEDGYLNSRTNFGCQSDWPDLLRYARKLDVSIEFRQGKAGVIINGEFFDEGAPLQKLLFKQTVNRDLQKAKRLSIQGPFLCMTDIQLKSSHSIFYNWKVSDLLVKFAIKARLSLLPTNFTKHVWNRDNDPSCPFCHQHTESVAHLMNGCREFHNFYSRRHNRIADKIFEMISGSLSGFQFHANKLAESILMEYGDELQRITHRKPDIVIIDNQSRKCIILEVTVCYDLYFEQSLNTKQERYQPLCSLLQSLGWDVDLKVLCFGSLGCIKKDVWTVMRSLSVDKLIVKNTLQWCSVSNLIMANYIWRHRVKKLFM